MSPHEPKKKQRVNAAFSYIGREILELAFFGDFLRELQNKLVDFFV